MIPTENELGLFGDLSGKIVLDIGCGSGHSLKWCGEHGAGELWGLDMSERQLENADKVLTESVVPHKLLCSPMEKDCGLPSGYFDIAYSIYAIGWTVEIHATFSRISSYLKKDGIFIFSWDHPLMHCVDVEDERIIFSGCYLEEDTFTFQKGGMPVTLQNRKLSTYINTLAQTGFAVERIVEQTDKESMKKNCEFTSRYYAPCKAKKFPLSFIIKARKL